MSSFDPYGLAPLDPLAPRTTQPATHVAPAASSLAVSPAWLAFRRSLGIEDWVDVATAQAQIDALNRRAGLTRGDLLERGVDERQGIANSFETRGLLRSGARLRDQAKQQAGEGRALADIELGLAEQSAALMANLAGRQAERQRSSAEQGLTVAERETVGGY